MQISVSVTDNDKDAPPWELGLDKTGQVSRDEFKYFIRRAQFQIAEEVLKEEQAKGFDDKPRVRTDNKWDKDPEDVRFMGKIEYFSRQSIAEALLSAYDLVLERSPQVTGYYKMSHYVFLNSRLIAEGKPELKWWLTNNSGQLKDGDKIRIVNVTPYAARIEVRGVRGGTRGKTKGKNVNLMKNSFGSGVYALAARAINSRYKAQGKIKFQVIPNGHAGVHVRASAQHRNSYIDDSMRSNKKRKRFSGPYVYPSILFTIAGDGIL